MKPGPSLRILLYLLLALGLLIVCARLVSTEGAELLSLLWYVIAAVGIFLCALDVSRLRRQPKVEMYRHLPRSLALGRKNHIRIVLVNPTQSVLKGRAIDHYPQGIDVEGIPVRFNLPPKGEIEISYDVIPSKRGAAPFGQIELLVESPNGFWLQRQRGADEEELRVYPDFMALNSLREHGYEHSLSTMGIHLQRKRGEGTDFRQLRHFREGDTLRQVDWKASSRVRKLISREYQDEHDQDIIFLLDCGRRMHNSSDQLSHFDHALNAMLLTAYYALHQGDRVGVCTFAGDPLWVDPVKHSSGINLLLDKLYDLQTTTQTTDFLDACKILLAKRKKRALIVLITNVQAEDSEDITIAMEKLRKRHSVILANLQETELHSVLEAEVDDLDSALAYSTATQVALERRRVLDVSRKRGIWVVDSLPQFLQQSLVTQYLALKRAGAI